MSKKKTTTLIKEEQFQWYCDLEDFNWYLAPSNLDRDDVQKNCIASIALDIDIDPDKADISFNLMLPDRKGDWIEVCDCSSLSTAKSIAQKELKLKTR